MKNILVPIGNHENATNTLQYAIDFAEKMNAKIYLAHIFSSSTISGSFVKMDNLLKKDSKNVLLQHLSKVDKKMLKFFQNLLKAIL